MVVTAPRTTISVRLRVSARRRSLLVDIDGKATTTTNCGRKSTALVRIRPPAYRPASCSSSTLRAITMSALERAKKASSTWEFRADSRITLRKPCASLCTPGSRGRRRKYHPATIGKQAPRPVPISAVVSLGCQAISAVPMISRGTPLSR